MKQPGLLARLASGLVPRLVLVNLLALFPLIILTLIQSHNIQAELSRELRNTVLALTQQAAQPQIDLVVRAQDLTRTLAVLQLEELRDVDLCKSVMERTAKAHPEFSLIGYIPPNGEMRCASQGHEYAFANTDFFRILTEGQVPRITLNRKGPVSRVPIISVSHPILDDAGIYQGIITVSIPQEGALSLTDMPPKMALNTEMLALTTFDSHGGILTSSAPEGAEEAYLPEGTELSELTASQRRTFDADDRNGARRIFAVVPITPDFSLLGVWSAEAHASLVPHALLPYVLAAVIALSGMGAAALASERLVMRHIRTLTQAMSKFRDGARSDSLPDLGNPPQEIAQLAEVYRSMVETIERDEAELENLLHQKENLLRELHHRTGNSLQLIASVLRMHLREAQDPYVRLILNHLLERVMSLSTVHLGLYRIAGSQEVAIDELLSDVIHKVDALHMRNERLVHVTQHLEEIHLASYQAVPLALLVAEVLSAFFSAAQRDAEKKIIVTLTATAKDPVVLTILGPKEARAQLTGQDGGAPELIAARLIRSFVRQLDGDLHITDKDGCLMFRVEFFARHNSSEISPSKPEAA